MTSREIYQKYLEVEKERMELESKIEKFVQRWSNGEINLSNKTIQETMDKGTARLDELRQIANRLHSEYMSQDKKEEEKRFADISVQHNLGVMPSQNQIVSGVLSSNGEESHLVAESKSSEQLAQERDQLLYQIKIRAMNKEISLAEASKLTADVNTAYRFFEAPIEQKSDGMHR